MRYVYGSCRASSERTSWYDDLRSGLARINDENEANHCGGRVEDFRSGLALEGSWRGLIDQRQEAGGATTKVELGRLHKDATLRPDSLSDMKTLDDIL
jgi:hypothetical protein